MKKQFRRSLWLVAFITLFQCVFAQGTERILSYHTDIFVKENGEFEVTETIKVYAAGDQINRGIFRDYPTLYKGDDGEWYRAKFSLKKVLRDDKEEPYKKEGHYHGKRIYIGEKDVLLEPGEYTYTIQYVTDRLMRYFQEYDEVYWNVTGNFWSFPIERSSVTIILPSPTTNHGVKTYCGTVGSDTNCNVRVITNHGKKTFRIINNNPLAAYEGFTFALAVDKNIVKTPSKSQQDIWFWNRDHKGILYAFLLLIIMIITYSALWYWVGVDPRRSTIIPLYAPPKDMLPSSLRYLMDMGYSDKILTATIVDLAVKGFLVIKEEKSGLFGKKYILTKTKEGDDSLAATEKTVLSDIFGGGETIEVDQEHYINFANAKKTLTGYLDSGNKKYFSLNYGYIALGFVFTITAIVCLFIYSSNDPSTEPLRKISLGVSLALGVAIAAILNWILKSSVQKEGIAFGITWGMIIVLLLFAGLYFYRREALSQSEWILGPIVIMAHIAVQFIFMQLIKAPSVEGRKLMDEVEGFQMFLEVGEKERMRMQNPPDLTPELFEKYLPHAIALGVENRWADKFEDVLSGMGDTGGSTGSGRGYFPMWYMGSSFGSGNDFNAGSFSSSIGSSFGSALGSSTSPPSSSGSGGFGGGGGGFSGGGGGGGGGGGW